MDGSEVNGRRADEMLEVFIDQFVTRALKQRALQRLGLFFLLFGADCVAEATAGASAESRAVLNAVESRSN